MSIKKYSGFVKVAYRKVALFLSVSKTVRVFRPLVFQLYHFAFVFWKMKLWLNFTTNFPIVVNELEAGKWRQYSAFCITVWELYDFENEKIAIKGLDAESWCLGTPYAGKNPPLPPTLEPLFSNRKRSENAVFCVFLAKNALFQKMSFDIKCST